MRRLAFSLALALSAWAPPESRATIQGAILKSDGPKPVLARWSSCTRPRGGGAQGLDLHDRRRGRYQFTGLDKDNAISYYVSTEYENALTRRVRSRRQARR
jgi:hypothetical protein